LHDWGRIRIDNRTKVRIVLIVATAIHLFFLGYLLTNEIEFAWQINAFLVTEDFAFFAILLSFGIFILLFIINELGYTAEEAEEDLDRLIEYAKKLIEYVNKHTLSIGIPLTIIGICLIGLPYFFLRDIKPYWNYETRKWVTGQNFGFIRTPLLLIGFQSLIIGLVFIGLYIRHPPSAGKQK